MKKVLFLALTILVICASALIGCNGGGENGSALQDMQYSAQDGQNEGDGDCEAPDCTNGEENKTRECPHCKHFKKRKGREPDPEPRPMPRHRIK